MSTLPNTQTIHVGDAVLIAPVGALPRVVLRDDGAVECHFICFTGSVVYRPKSPDDTNGASRIYSPADNVDSRRNGDVCIDTDTSVRSTKDTGLRMKTKRGLMIGGSFGTDDEAEEDIENTQETAHIPPIVSQDENYDNPNSSDDNEDVDDDSDGEQIVGEDSFIHQRDREEGTIDIEQETDNDENSSGNDDGHDDDDDDDDEYDEDESNVAPSQASPNVNETNGKINDGLKDNNNNDDDVNDDDDDDDDDNDDDDDDDDDDGNGNTDNDGDALSNDLPMIQQVALCDYDHTGSCGGSDTANINTGFLQSQDPKDTLNEDVVSSQKPRACLKRTSSEARCLDTVIKSRKGGEGKRVRFNDTVMDQHEQSGQLSFAPYWQKIVTEGAPSIPIPRWGCSLTLVEPNKLVLIGGESAGRILEDSTVMTLDLGSSSGKYSSPQWVGKTVETPDLPTGGRAWHTATMVCSDNSPRIVVFGGEKMEAKRGRTPRSDVLVFDIAFGAWFPPEIQGPSPKPRAGHAAAVLPNGHQIAFFGGVSPSGKWLNDLVVLNTNQWKWECPKSANRFFRPAARSYCSLTTAGEYVVCFGGNASQRSFSDVHFLLPDTLKWVRPDILGSKPKPRCGHVAVAASPTSTGLPRIYYYGGWDDQGKTRVFFDDVWELTIESRTTCRFALKHPGGRFSGSPGSRTGCALTVAKSDEAYLFGGWGQCGNDLYMNDLHKLHLR